MLTTRTWINHAARTVGHQRAWKLASTALHRPIHALWIAPLSPQEHATLERSLAEYLVHKPLTRISGQTEFCGYTFDTSPAVLDPRPETEMLVAHAVNLRPSSVLDLGTGSGCIVCATLATLADRGYKPRALGTDISASALAIAARNAERLGVECEFKLSDWCTNVHEKFDLVVSNPPYISTNAQLPPEVWAYDPPIALYGGTSGTLAHSTGLPQLPRILNPGATVLWEIGYDQREWILNFARDTFPNAVKIAIVEDYNQLPRMLQIKLDMR